jgi:hypothetical protein
VAKNYNSAYSEENFVVDTNCDYCYTKQVSKKEYKMQNELETLLDNIRADYLAWTSQYGKRELSDINKKMIDTFNTSLSIKAGRKYIKIISGGSVWGFVVAGEDDKVFSKGTILKAAGWATPARNFSRGNIVDGGYKVNWTGTV